MANKKLEKEKKGAEQKMAPTKLKWARTKSGGGHVGGILQLSGGQKLSK